MSLIQSKNGNTLCIVDGNYIKRFHPRAPKISCHVVSPHEPIIGLEHVAKDGLA